jgi:hypothetical protein
MHQFIAGLPRGLDLAPAPAPGPSPRFPRLTRKERPWQVAQATAGSIWWLVSAASCSCTGAGRGLRPRPMRRRRGEPPAGLLAAFSPSAGAGPVTLRSPARR